MLLPALVAVPEPDPAWGVEHARPRYVGPVMPTDVKLVITALLVVLAVAGLIIQVLTSSVLIGVLVGLAGAFFVSAFIWMTRL
jgi:hypothetical protein